MKITKTEVEQIASLARLELTAVEVDAMAHDLASILDHMEALREVDVTAAPPMGGVSEHPAPFREDASGADALGFPIERLGPAIEEGFFVVPRLAALDADAVTTEESSA